TQAPAEAGVAVAPAVAGPGAPVDRLVRGPPPRAVDAARIVIGNVDDFRRGGLDDVVLLVAAHDDLRARLEVARGVGTASQVLDGVRHELGLREEGLPEALRPAQVLVEAREHLREGDQRLHAGIPRLAVHGAHGVLALQAGIGPRPARRLRHL